MLAVLFVTSLLAAGLWPTTSSSSPYSGTSPEPILTFCSGQSSPHFTSSPGAVTSGGELGRFLDAVCASAYGGAAHMSHNMSWHIAGNRTLYGVAQCRPDVPVHDCAACLAAASSHLVSRRTACAASAVWHDACFLRYSDRDPSMFRDDEYTATVFNATSRSRMPLSSAAGGRAAVRRLLAAAGSITMSSHMCRGVGAGTAHHHGGRMYGLTRCAAGVTCEDCRRCLRGSVAAADREYNGSAGMQVLRLSCMARYESYPFYNTASLQSNTDYIPLSINGTGPTTIGAPGGAGERRLNTSASPPAAAPPPPPMIPPGSHTTHTPPAEAPPTGGGAGGGPPPVPPAAQNPSPAVHRADPPPPPAATPPDQIQVVQQSHEKKTPKMLIMLIVTIASGLVVASVILVLIIWYRRKQPPAQKGHARDGVRGENMYDQGEEQWSKEEEDEDGKSKTFQFYSYQVLEAATSHFSSSNKLGSGGFGTVFKGTLDNGNEIAVKMLKDSKRNIQELEREISIVADLRHKNLVRCLGYCFQEGGRFLVYEYVPNNSLEKFWCKACFHQKLEWATWFNIIKGVARGLRFLHDKGIIHRDLKPHNVLLDENFNPKIADFDLMRMYDKQKTHESTEKVAGTFGYMAPECTSGRKFLLSIKSDVYSYGVLVLEIITGHKIYTFEGQNSEGLVEYVSRGHTQRQATASHQRWSFCWCGSTGRRSEWQTSWTASWASTGRSTRCARR
ncbi:unnamed protein product [Urochloa humidicola]